MPKYQNDSSDTTYRVENWSGEKVNVGPGDTVRTYKELTESDFSIVSQKPYYKNTVQVTKPTGAADRTISLNKKTNNLEIYNESSFAMRVFFNSKSNKPGTEILSSTYRTFEGIKNYASSIVLSFDGSIASGEVVVTEFKE